MKKIFYLFIIVFAAGNLAFSQTPPANKPDTELTCDEAIARIQELQLKVNALDEQMKKADAGFETLKAKLDETNAKIKECGDELKRLLGIQQADFEAFRQKLGVIEAKIRELKALADDALADRQDDVLALENQLNALRGEKIAIYPEFYNKIIFLAKEIKGLYREKKIHSYTVGTWAEDKDCLWNIAGKMEIFGDPFLWPKIWQANKDLIRNPDIIFPGQVLKLPEKGPKSSDELKAERRYWRNKRQAAEAKAGETTGAKSE